MFIILVLKNTKRGGYSNVDSRKTTVDYEIGLNKEVKSA